jgi:FKBP-type peptidyl-prolyl cis-trans isomerase
MKKIISIVLIAIVILALVITFIYFKNRNTSKNTIMNEPYVKTAILKEGKGEEAVNGSHITVNYTGWLTNGTKFDSSLDRNRPLEFTLGSHEVIEG